MEEVDSGAGIKGPLMWQGGVGIGKVPNVKSGRNIQSTVRETRRACAFPVSGIPTSDLSVILSLSSWKTLPPRDLTFIYVVFQLLSSYS